MNILRTTKVSVDSPNVSTDVDVNTTEKTREDLLLRKPCEHCRPIADHTQAGENEEDLRLSSGEHCRPIADDTQAGSEETVCEISQGNEQYPKRTAEDSLKRLRSATRRNQETRFTALMHHLSLDMLKMAFCELKANAASGIDKITWHDYKEKLDENLSSLLARIKSDAFRATPVRRQFIPKSSGGKRPLGICIVEDKIVQGAIKLILESIYDPLFLPQSYGFRPNTRAHDALDALYMGIYDFKSKVHFILDADIKACFDNIDQNLLKSILSLKIGDKRMIRLIDRLLKAGVYDHGTVHKSEKGVVQGSVLSPLLANIFLDWVLDRFVVWWRTNMAKGQIIYTRYADDFIIGFERKDEAERFFQVLQDRLLCAGLKLNTEKSRLIEFGKDARRERNEKGEGRPDTFNFLGFTHSCSVTFKERKYKILRRCISKRLQRKINEVYKKLRYLILSCDIEKAITWVNQFLKGYYTYFAVHDNLGALKTLRYRILLIIWKFMNRRSQKAYVSSEKFFATIPSRIVKPKVKHAYPSERLEKRQETLRNFRQGITKAKSVS